MASFSARKKTLCLILIGLGGILSFLGYQQFDGKKNRRLLIIGCGSSGTSYMSKVLKKCAVKVKHEHHGKEGVVSWKMTVDAEEVPSGHSRKGYHFAHIFHQVRHPLKMISSFYNTEPPGSWEFIMKHVPEINKDDLEIVKCAKYWYYWNTLAEQQAEWTYRIEEIDHQWDEFEKRLGKRLDKRALKNIPRNVNTRGSHRFEFTWDDLEQQLDPDLYQKVRTLAQKYGYS